MSEEAANTARYEEIADLLTSSQIGVLRRCKPGESIRAIITIGWKHRDGEDTDVAWSAGFPPDISAGQAVQMFREAAKVLLWQASEIESGR